MESFYRLVLRLYPRAFQQKHAAEMADVFAFMVEQSRSSSRGVRARAFTLICLYADVLLQLPAAHARAFNLPVGRYTFMTKSFRFELKQAVRALSRQPAATTLVILMLTLGVAANTTVFGLINALFLRPLPWQEPAELMYLNETAPTWNLEYTGINYPDFVSWKKHAKRFESMAIYDLTSFNFSDGANAERLDGMAVTHEYFDVLRVKPIIGRGFTPAEDTPNGARVALISEELWRTRFGGRSDVLGRAIRLQSQPVTIIGVVPREASVLQASHIWVPYRGDPAQTWQSYSDDAIGRVRPGTTLAQARQDLMRAHQPIWDERDGEKAVSPRIELLRDRYVGDYSLLTLALGGGVAIVLLIACANVSSVMLARATARQREIGIRRALGAGTGRIARQMLIESAVVAAAGTVFGVIWGYWAVKTLSSFLPDEAPAWVRFDADARLLAFAAAIAFLTALISGIAPLVQSIRSGVQASLATNASGRASASRANRRTLNGLVIAEVALAFVLLVGAGLFLRAYNQVRDIDPGFDTRNAVLFGVSLPIAKYPDGASSRAFYSRLRDKLATIPGVHSAAAISCPPFGCHQGNFVQIEGIPPRSDNEPNPVVLVRIASAEYARTIGLRMKDGRFLNAADDAADSARVMVVNETFARTFLGDQNPVGKRVRFGREGRWHTVVGLARDVKHYGLDQEMRPGVYLPSSAIMGPYRLAQVLRTDLPVDAIAPGIRAAMREIDPELPIFGLNTIEGELQRSLSVRKMYSWLLIVFASVALVLAVGGIYGVLSYVVSQRRREIGIRVALGAQRTNVMRLIVSQGALVGVAGIVIGLAAAIPVSRLFKTLLFDVPTTDFVTYAGVAGVLGLTVLLAAFVPARRALSYQPQAVLRDG